MCVCVWQRRREKKSRPNEKIKWRTLKKGYDETKRERKMENKKPQIDSRITETTENRFDSEAKGMPLHWDSDCDSFLLHFSCFLFLNCRGFVIDFFFCFQNRKIALWHSVYWKTMTFAKKRVKKQNKSARKAQRILHSIRTIHRENVSQFYRKYTVLL